MPLRKLRVLSASVGVLFLLGGGGLAATAGLQAASGGAFTTPQQHLTTPAAALKTDEIQVDSDSAHAADPDPDIGELAEVTLTVRASDPDVPIFVGIGPTAQVERYLRDTSHADFVSAELDPVRPSFRQMPGGAARPPDAQEFWVASSSGTGTRQLTWDKTQGAWSAVALRLDGRPGVDIHARIGLRFGFLTPAAAGILTAGALLLGHLALTRRGRKEPTSTSGPSPHSSGEQTPAPDGAGMERTGATTPPVRQPAHPDSPPAS